MRRHTLGLASAILLGLCGLGGCGTGDHLVAGLANNNNSIYVDPSQELAEALARHPGVPPVTDEMLAAGFDAIRRRAGEGDPESVLILYRVADRQRVERDE
jgi:hypothetical protein